jgi:hypothetical protein
MPEPSTVNADYHWTLEGLLDEERRLRGLAEAEVRGYRKLLVAVAMHLAPHVVDSARRQNPLFPAQLSADEWLALFTALPPSSPGPTRNGWGLAHPAESQLAEAQRQIGRLEAEKAALAQRVAEMEEEAASGWLS